MKEQFKTIFKDKIILISFWGSVILFVAVMLYVLIMYQQLPPLLPLYNRMPWGYSRLGTNGELFLPIGLSFTFFIINLFAAATVYRKVIFTSRIISIVSFTITLCMSIYVYKIMQLIL